MRHGTFPRLRQSLNLWHPVICQSSHILPETFMISTLTMSIIKKMRAFLLAISFKYYKLKGGYRDSNPGPPEPQSGALTNCAIPTMSKFLWVSGKTPDNVLEGIRTPDPRLRRPLLYPAELRTHVAAYRLGNVYRTSS